VPYVLLPRVLPVRQAGLSSHLDGAWHQPITQLLPSTVIRVKDPSTGATFTESPETSHPSWEGFADPAEQQREQGCCREQTWGRQSQFTYAMQLITIIRDVVCSVLVYLLLYITLCIIACRNPFCP